MYKDIYIDHPKILKKSNYKKDRLANGPKKSTEIVERRKREQKLKGARTKERLSGWKNLINIF